MIVELKKDIKLYTLEFIGEVEFFDKESPYIELLKNVDTESELIETLNENDMSKPAINNIIKMLESLKVLDNGDLVNIENGFSNKEYGKYSLELFENETPFPFKHKNKEIKRKQAVSNNTKIIDSIKKQKSISNILDIKSKNFSNNLEFKVNQVEKDKYYISLYTEKELKITYEDQWSYQLENRSFEMDSISFNDLFKGEWDEEYEALKISFSLLKEEIFKVNMEYTYQDNLDLDNYGSLKADFKSIPIIPKTSIDAKEWFLYLLKKEIEEQNSYISKDELEQIWYNLLDNKPRFKKFEDDLSFDFEMILKEFGKNSKYYWLLKAGIDLYPFDNNLPPNDRIYINKLNDFSTKFNFEIKDIVIVDNYINTTRHFKILENVLNNMNNPTIKIFTQKTFFKEQTPQEIDKITEKYDIDRNIKVKSELPHKRYWLFNKTYIYMTGDSLDKIDSTSFDKYDLGKIEKEAYKILKGEIDE